MNTYDRVDHPGREVAKRYLDGTKSFWRQVRGEWNAVFARHRRLKVQHAVDGAPLFEKLFPLAQSLKAASAAEQRAAVKTEIARFVEPAEVKGSR